MSGGETGGESGGTTGDNTDKIAAAKTVVETALEEITATNETTKDEILAAVQNALTEAESNVTPTIAEEGGFNKTEATKQEEGSIAVVITLTLNGESDTVSKTLTIAKLPKTDAEMVAEAKELIGTFLASYEPGIFTEKSDIQSAIQTMLTEAGNTASVSIGDTDQDFKKTDATTEASGSIEVKVTVSSGEAEETMEKVTLTIKKLEKKFGMKIAMVASKPDGKDLPVSDFATITELTGWEESNISAWASSENTIGCIYTGDKVFGEETVVKPAILITSEDDVQTVSLQVMGGDYSTKNITLDELTDITDFVAIGLNNQSDGNPNPKGFTINVPYGKTVTVTIVEAATDAEKAAASQSGSGQE